MGLIYMQIMREREKQWTLTGLASHKLLNYFDCH